MNKRFLQILREIFGDKFRTIDTEVPEYRNSETKIKPLFEEPSTQLPIWKGPYVPKKTEPSEHMKRHHKGGRKIKFDGMEEEFDMEYKDYHPGEDSDKFKIEKFFNIKGKK